jgi:DNA-directed RNA polymerase subunit M/transcription elongation factor TFIIS
MNFCPECDNLLYYMTKEGKRSYYCKSCNYTREINTLNETNSLIYENYIKEQPLHYEFVVNEYTKNDPTLPKSNTIVCPNKECPCNKGDTPRDVRYIKHDPEAMKFIYICSVCDTKWKSTY